MTELENGFLLKVNAGQFRKLFPHRSNKFMAENEQGKIVIVDSIPAPTDVILCDYSCNSDLSEVDFFYLYMIDLELVMGTMCVDCSKQLREEEGMSVKDFDEVF